jgi:hypothetical protein
MMPESTIKISVEELSRDRSFHVHKDDSTLFSFTRIHASDENVEHRFAACAATLCFLRGTGKIAINDSLVEYGGKWFEIPRWIDYQIFPETDTVMLTIQRPTRDSIEMDEPRSGGAIYDARPMS